MHKLNRLVVDWTPSVKDWPNRRENHDTRICWSKTSNFFWRWLSFGDKISTSGKTEIEWRWCCTPKGFQDRYRHINVDKNVLEQHTGIHVLIEDPPPPHCDWLTLSHWWSMGWDKKLANWVLKDANKVLKGVCRLSKYKNRTCLYVHSTDYRFTVTESMTFSVNISAHPWAQMQCAPIKWKKAS